MMQVFAAAAFASSTARIQYRFHHDEADSSFGGSFDATIMKHTADFVMLTHASVLRKLRSAPARGLCERNHAIVHFIESSYPRV